MASSSTAPAVSESENGISEIALLEGRAVKGGGGERERERERKREGEKRDRQRERQTDREREFHQGTLSIERLKARPSTFPAVICRMGSARREREREKEREKERENERGGGGGKFIQGLTP